MQKLLETNCSIVYEAEDEKDKKRVIAKIIKTRNVTPSETARFQQKYEKIKSLNLLGLVNVHDVIIQNDVYALILEHFSGARLKDFIKPSGMDIKSFLGLSIKAILESRDRPWASFF